MLRLVQKISIKFNCLKFKCFFIFRNFWMVNQSCDLVHFFFGKSFYECVPTSLLTMTGWIIVLVLAKVAAGLSILEL